MFSPGCGRGVWRFGTSIPFWLIVQSQIPPALRKQNHQRQATLGGHRVVASRRRLLVARCLGFLQGGFWVVASPPIQTSVRVTIPRPLKKHTGWITPKHLRLTFRCKILFDPEITVDTDEPKWTLVASKLENCLRMAASRKS